MDAQPALTYPVPALAPASPTPTECPVSNGLARGRADVPRDASGRCAP